MKTKILQTERRAPYLGQRGDFLLDWEERHLAAPGERQDYEALRRAFDFIKRDDEHQKEGEEYIPCLVWLQSHAAGAAEFNEVIEYACAEYMQKIIDRAEEYIKLAKLERVQARMDGATAYHVRRVTKGVVKQKGGKR